MLIVTLVIEVRENDRVAVLIAQRDRFRGQTGVPTGVTVLTPSFQVSAGGSLRVRFTLAKQTGYDTRTQTRLYSFVNYDREITLRNSTPN